VGSSLNVFLLKTIVANPLKEAQNKKLSKGNGDKRWSSWLRHYASSRQVAVSSPDEVIGFFS
jgi:hypothetical protein